MGTLHDADEVHRRNCRSSDTPRTGVPPGIDTFRYYRHSSRQERKDMTTEIEDEMRTAMRQAGAIAAVSGRHSFRQTLGLAHELYDALILLRPKDRGSRARGFERRRGDL